MSNPIAESITSTLTEHLEFIAESGSSPERLQRWFEEQTEPAYLTVLMKFFHGNQSAMATAMGINRATLRTRLKRHNLI